MQKYGLHGVQHDTGLHGEHGEHGTHGHGHDPFLVSLLLPFFRNNISPSCLISSNTAFSALDDFNDFLNIFLDQLIFLNNF